MYVLPLNFCHSCASWPAQQIASRLPRLPWVAILTLRPISHISFQFNIPRYKPAVRFKIPFVFPFIMIVSTRIDLISHYRDEDSVSHNSLLFFASSAWWRRLGAVVLPSPLWTPCSMSAAQRAAPTVFVKEKKMPAIGTSSRRTAGTPKLKNVSTMSPYIIIGLLTWHTRPCASQRTAPSRSSSSA